MMKKRFAFLLFAITILISCNKPINEGNVIFYSSSNIITYPIQITILRAENGSIETWTDSISSATYSPPDCATKNGAIFTLPVGTYNYNASSVNNASAWKGSISITSNGCFTQSLQ